MNKSLIYQVLALLLLGFVGYGAYYYGKQQNLEEIQVLEDQLKDLPGIQQDAAVVKRVSKQMEDIAYQQKELSDKQREKAEKQTEIANSMRLRAEHEQQQAKISQQRALTYARHADSLRNLAYQQMMIAEDSRQEALHAKNVSDTLSYRTLGRSLGAASMSQYGNGNIELGKLLAYASWNFTTRYDGNDYQPETFMALMNATETKHTYHIGSRGAITSIYQVP